MNNSNRPLARKQGIVVQEMPDEILIYDTAENKAHCLNISAAVVWKACDGTNSIDDIIRQFERNGHGSVNENFVWLALDQLDRYGLMERKYISPTNGQSRRQAIKTLALSTAVALPVIASLAAPPNAFGAASCACPSPSPASCAVMTGCPSIINCNPSGICAP